MFQMTVTDLKHPIFRSNDLQKRSEIYTIVKNTALVIYWRNLRQIGYSILCVF